MLQQLLIAYLVGLTAALIWENEKQDFFKFFTSNECHSSFTQAVQNQEKNLVLSGTLAKQQDIFEEAIGCSEDQIPFIVVLDILDGGTSVEEIPSSITNPKVRWVRYFDQTRYKRVAGMTIPRTASLFQDGDIDDKVPAKLIVFLERSTSSGKSQIFLLDLNTGGMIIRAEVNLLGSMPMKPYSLESKKEQGTTNIDLFWTTDEYNSLSLPDKHKVLKATIPDSLSNDPLDLQTQNANLVPDVVSSGTPCIAIMDNTVYTGGSIEQSGHEFPKLTLFSWDLKQKGEALFFKGNAAFTGRIDDLDSTNSDHPYPVVFGLIMERGVMNFDLLLTEFMYLVRVAHESSKMGTTKLFQFKIPKGSAFRMNWNTDAGVFYVNIHTWQTQSASFDESKVLDSSEMSMIKCAGLFNKVSYLTNEIVSCTKVKYFNSNCTSGLTKKCELDPALIPSPSRKSLRILAGTNMYYRIDTGQQISNLQPIFQIFKGKADANAAEPKYVAQSAEVSSFDLLFVTDHSVGIVVDQTEGPDPGTVDFTFSTLETYYSVVAEKSDSLLASTFYNAYMVEDSSKPRVLRYFVPKNTTTTKFPLGVRLAVHKEDSNVDHFEATWDATDDELSTAGLTGDYRKFIVDKDPQVASKVTYHFVSSYLQTQIRPPVTAFQTYYKTTVVFSIFPSCVDATPGGYDYGPTFDSVEKKYYIYYLDGYVPSLSIQNKFFFPKAPTANCFMYFDNIYLSPSRTVYVGEQFKLTGGQIGDAVHLEFTNKGVDEEVTLLHSLGNQDASTHSELGYCYPIKAIKTTCATGSFSFTDPTIIVQEFTSQSAVDLNLEAFTTSVTVFDNACDPEYTYELLEGSIGAFTLMNKVFTLNPNFDLDSERLHVIEISVQFPSNHQGRLFQEQFALVICDSNVGHSISGDFEHTLKSNHGMVTLDRKTTYESLIEGFKECPPSKFGFDQASNEFALSLESPVLLTIKEHLGDITVDTGHAKFMSGTVETYSFQISLLMSTTISKLAYTINIDYCWDADISAEWINYNEVYPYVMRRAGTGTHMIIVSDGYQVTSNSSMCFGEDFEAFFDQDYNNKYQSTFPKLEVTKQADHRLLVTFTIGIESPKGVTFYQRLKKSKSRGYINFRPISYFVCGGETLEWNSGSSSVVEHKVPWSPQATGIQKYSLASFIDQLELSDDSSPGCRNRITNPIKPDLLRAYPATHTPASSNSSATEIQIGGAQVVNFFSSGGDSIGVLLGAIPSLPSGGATLELSVGFYTYYGMKYAFKPFKFTICEAKYEVIKALSFFFQREVGTYEVANFVTDYLKPDESCPSDEWKADVLRNTLVFSSIRPTEFNSLEIDTNQLVGTTDQFFFRYSLPTGGVIGTSELTVRVCPAISLAQDPLEMEVEININDARSYVNLSASFDILKPSTKDSVYSYCTFLRAAVVTNTNGDLPSQASFLGKALSFEGTWLKLLVEEATFSSTYSFFIKATNRYGSESYRQATLKIKKQVNDLPRFDGELQTDFTIIFDAQDMPKTSELFYESPEIKDPNGNPIEVQVDYEASLSPALDIKFDKSSSILTLEVDTSRLTVPEHLGNHTITVKLIDTTQAYLSTTTKFTLEIIQESAGSQGGGSGSSNSTSTNSSNSLLEQDPGASIVPSELSPEQVDEILEDQEGYDDLSEESQEDIAEVVPGLFPGITISQLFDLLRALIARKKALEAGEPRKIEPPRVEITSFQESRVVTFKFSKPLVAPHNLAMIDYSTIFAITSKSAIDNSIHDPDKEKKEESSRVNARQLESAVEPDFPTEEASNEIAFTWSVEEHTPTRISILLEFDRPEIVSSTKYGRDLLEIRVLDMGPFVDAETGEPLTREDFGFSLQEATIDIAIPPLLSPEEKEIIQASVKSIGTMVSSVSFGNFLLGILTSGSMQHLWGLIRAVQLIVLTALMEIVFPANAAEFYKRAILFANMDLLSGEQLYEKIFSFRQIPPLSAKFDDMDYNDLTFIMNSGSVFILLVLILLEPVGRVLITAIALVCRKRKGCRTIGIWFHKKTKLELAKEGVLRLFMESYFEICMCTFLNLVSFLSAAELKEHFQTFDDSLNASLAILFLGCVFAFPAWAIVLIRRSLQADHKADPALSLFFEEFEPTSPFKALYQAIFLIRRLLLVAILVFMRDSVFFQCMFVAHLSLLNLFYLTYYKPFKLEQSNRLEAFNELTVLFSSTVILTFLNAGSELSFREFTGWLLVGVACLNIGVNLISAGFEALKDLYLNGRVLYFKKLDALEAEATFEHWNVFKKKFPWISKAEFKEIKTEYLVRQYCREWSQHRTWLLYHGVDLKEFRQELKYKKLMAKFNMREKARSQKGAMRQVEVAAKLKTKRHADSLKKISFAKALVESAAHGDQRSTLLGQLPSIIEVEEKSCEIERVRHSKHFVEFKPVSSRLDKLSINIEQAKDHRLGGVPEYVDLDFALSSKSGSGGEKEEEDFLASEIHIEEGRLEEWKQKAEDHVPIFEGKGSLKSVVQALFEVDEFVREVVQQDPIVDDDEMNQFELQVKDDTPIGLLRKAFEQAVDPSSEECLTPATKRDHRFSISVSRLQSALFEEQGRSSSPRGQLQALLRSIDNQFPPIGEETFGFKFACKAHCPSGNQECSKITNHEQIVLELEVDHSIASSFATFLKTKWLSCRQCGQPDTREKFIISEYPKSFVIAPKPISPEKKIVLSHSLPTKAHSYQIKSAVVQTGKSKYGCLILKEGIWILIGAGKVSCVPKPEVQAYLPVLVLYA